MFGFDLLFRRFAYFSGNENFGFGLFDRLRFFGDVPKVLGEEPKFFGEEPNLGLDFSLIGGYFAPPLMLFRGDVVYL